MGTIPTPATFVAGTSVGLTAQLNGLRDSINFWANTPKCYAYQTVATSLTSGTTTVLPLGGELYDIVQAGDTASHDNTTNSSRIVVRTAGKYQISGNVSFATTTGTLTATVRKNAAGLNTGGTLVLSARSPAAAGISSILNLPGAVLDLAVGDYLELFASQNSGSTVLTDASGTQATWMSIWLVGS